MAKAKFELELYILGRSAKSETALENLRRFCSSHLADRHRIIVIDVLDDPEAAERANIVATPTVIRKLPVPPRRIVGDLSRTDALFRGLGVEADSEPGDTDD